VHIDITQGRPSHQVRRDAAKSEDLGFAGFWVGETHRDPFLCAQQAIDGTERIAVGTAVAIALARTPMTVAYSGYDLAAHSSGRFVLGLGSQVKPHIERRFSMPWSQPAARMREFVLALRAIWASWEQETRLDFDGEFYRHTLMTPFFAPDRHDAGTPPVFLAAVGEAMTAVTGEVADGLIFHPFTTPRYLREVTFRSLSAGGDRAGRAVGEVEVCGPVFVCIGRDDEELEQAILASRRRLAFYGSTPSYRPVLELHGWGDLQPELTELSKRGAWDEMAGLIDDEVLEAFAVVGTPPEVSAELDARWGDLASRVSLYTPYEVPVETLAALADARR
jgi:probable F420-dependent oxidoreductase